MVASSDSNGNITGPVDKYTGPSYSVKYLGIVDGSMGVLSRKMALLNYNQARNLHAGVTTVPQSTTVGGGRVPQTGGGAPQQPASSLSNERKSTSIGQSNSQNVLPHRSQPKNRVNILGPVLTKKYTQIV